MTIDKKRVRALQEKRAKLAESKIEREKNKKYGPRVVGEINAALNQTLSVDDFNLDINAPTEFKFSRSLDLCEGLVISHTNKQKVVDALSCCSRILGELNGLIGVDGYRGMGLAKVKLTDAVKLVSVAESLNDSILFYPMDVEGVLLVDFYEILGAQGANDYSIVVQGVGLEEMLSPCFSRNG